MQHPIPRLLGAFALMSSAAAQPAPAQNKPDATLGSTPDTVVWGYIPARVPPVLRIRSGATVRIDTMSHQGLLTKDDPVTFFGAAGAYADEGAPLPTMYWLARITLGL